MYEQIGNLGKKMKTIQKELNGNSRTEKYINKNFIGRNYWQVRDDKESVGLKIDQYKFYNLK